MPALCKGGVHVGAVGTLLRYSVSVLTSPTNQELPWETIGINVAGSFVIGFFGTLTLSHGRFPVSENTRLFVMIGLCGGFTTFSSFSLQTFDLMRTGAYLRAGINIVASVALCLCAVSLGHLIAARLNGQAAQIAQVAMEEEANFTQSSSRLS
jgi:CrcB protein